MEQRIALTQGANVERYIIDDVIGFGASCLVYKAHFLDNANHQKEVILKECYPYYAGTTRIGNKIVWSNAEERDAAFLRFRQAYDVASEIQNTANAKSVSAYSLEILPENGTQYVITIPDGDSYDKTKSDDIADIVRTALALTNAVGMYHKAGYLHLDIKPSNFIATADQTGQGKNIVLFDVDTVVSIENIQSGKLRGVSYSKEYAAPEQKQQKVKKLCPATDLYAVGAVLFERLMNRRADCTDACMFAEWEFDSRFDIKNVKPKAKRLLTEIFHKTLAANIKRRYQSADELAAALEALRKVICEPAPYMYSYPLNTTCHFVGRRDDLAQLHHALADSRLVFVKGAGGIGKTELVRKYVSIHQDEYDAVVFMLYNGSVSDCLNDIEIIGVDSEDKNKKTLLREICDNDKVLLILDNYDVAPNESKGLDELLDLNCKVIVTTRTDFSERNPSARFIEVAGLSAKALRVIFENESDCTLSDSELDELKSILPIGKQCTYFWSMIARLAKEGAYTVSEIVEKVSAGLDDLAESEDVFDTKDGSFINTTVAAAMLVLFKLDELGDNEFEVLNALYFLDCLNMDKRQIKEMLAFSEIKLMNSFNALVKKGYIQRLTVASREVYRISDVLRNVLEYREELEISKFGIVTAFIEKELHINKNDMDKLATSNVYRDHVYNIFTCLFKIFTNIQWNILGNAVYCINILYNSAMGEESVFHFTKRDYATAVMDNIRELSRKSEILPLIRIKIVILRILWYCSWFLRKLWHHDQSKTHELAEIIELLFYAVLNEMAANKIADPEIVNYLCKPIAKAIKRNFLTSGLLHNRFYFSSDIIKKIILLNPSCLQNEDAHVSNSFKVVCLRDNACEKIHLKNTLKKLKKAKHGQKNIIALTAIIMIAFNGKDVAIDIDNELKLLRIRVLFACRKMFIVSKSGILLNCKNKKMCELIPGIKPSEEDSILKPVTVGINRLYQSITSSKIAMESNEKNQPYPSFKDSNGKHCIDLFLSTMDKIDSSDCLYYFISEFDNTVKLNCSFGLEDYEKQKYIDVSAGLENKLNEIAETGNFIDVLCDGSFYMDYDEVKSKLDYATAIMFIRFRNYDLAYKYLNSEMDYLKASIKKKNKIDDNCFVLEIAGLINNNATWLAVPLLYSLIEYLRDIFKITDDTDERLYSLYYWLVLSAHSAKEEMKSDSTEPHKSKTDCQSLHRTAQDYDDLIEKYTKLIEQISGQKYHPEIE